MRASATHQHHLLYTRECDETWPHHPGRTIHGSGTARNFGAPYPVPDAGGGACATRNHAGGGAKCTYHAVMRACRCEVRRSDRESHVVSPVVTGSGMRTTRSMHAGHCCQLAGSDRGPETPALVATALLARSRARLGMLPTIARLGRPQHLRLGRPGGGRVR